MVESMPSIDYLYPSLEVATYIEDVDIDLSDLYALILAQNRSITSGFSYRSDLPLMAFYTNPSYPGDRYTALCYPESYTPSVRACRIQNPPFGFRLLNEAGVEVANIHIAGYTPPPMDRVEGLLEFSSMRPIWKGIAYRIRFEKTFETPVDAPARYYLAMSVPAVNIYDEAGNLIHTMTGAVVIHAKAVIKVGDRDINYTARPELNYIVSIDDLTFSQPVSYRGGDSDGIQPYAIYLDSGLNNNVGRFYIELGKEGQKIKKIIVDIYYFPTLTGINYPVKQSELVSINTYSSWFPDNGIPIRNPPYNLSDMMSLWLDNQPMIDWESEGYVDWEPDMVYTRASPQPTAFAIVMIPIKNE